MRSYYIQICDKTDICALLGYYFLVYLASVVPKFHLNLLYYCPSDSNFINRNIPIAG